MLRTGEFTLQLQAEKASQPAASAYMTQKDPPMIDLCFGSCRKKPKSTATRNRRGGGGDQRAVPSFR